jgi:hypothetical protein
MEVAPPTPYNSEHHAVWLEELLELSNNFGAPSH